ncbi:hypothetical protein GQ53DRAFT_785066 [Thozetella sp. PMI_491]|nr:hypothetical protein GQ53DRAFT_785066 [Thozetella sp. PMI_491]
MLSLMLVCGIPAVRGTCVFYNVLFNAFKAWVRDYTWIEAGEREYTYLSILENYIKFFNIFCFIFYYSTWVDRHLAGGGVDFLSENFVSCNTIRIGKPAPELYYYILDKFPKENREIWVATVHMWDAAAVQRRGKSVYRFRGAWASVWERETC